MNVLICKQCDRKEEVKETVHYHTCDNGGGMGRMKTWFECKCGNQNAVQFHSHSLKNLYDLEEIEYYMDYRLPILLNRKE